MHVSSVKGMFSQASMDALPMFVKSCETEESGTALRRKIAARIGECGPITLHDYIEACLYDPDHGYYRIRNAVGAKGDFITAPEVSQIFGELIGLWAAEIWRGMDSPAALHLIELGPGRGTLLADALRAARVLPAFRRAIKLHLVETSATHRRLQKAALSGCADIHWHESLASVPPGPSIIIANEFLDCLPVRQYRFDGQDGVWREAMVFAAGGKFQISAGPAMTPPFLPPAGPLNHSVFEYRPGVEVFAAALASRAAIAPLAALIADYGHAASAYGDTLQAVVNHKFTSLFDAPGEADITAHVDFDHVKRECGRRRLQIFGPLLMGEWLLQLGLEIRLARLVQEAKPEQAANLQSGARRLTDPLQMGALFKVLTVMGANQPPPPPYA